MRRSSHLGLLLAVAGAASLAGCREHLGSAPQPTQVTPQWAYEAMATSVVIAGQGLAPHVSTDFSLRSSSLVDTQYSVSLGDHLLSAVRLQADGTLSAVVPPSVPVGTYALTVADPLGRQGTLDAAFRVVAAGDAAAAVAGFHFDALAEAEAGTPFTVTITAVDGTGAVVPDFNGTATLTDRTGTARPTTVGAFTLGRWTGSVEVSTPVDADELAVRGPLGQAGVSPLFKVRPRPPHAVVFRSPARTAVAGTCSEPVTLELVDDLGTARLAEAELALTVAPSAPTGFSLYADDACATPLASPRIAAGASSLTVRFRSTRAGSVVLFASAAGYPTVRQLEQVAPAPPAALVFTSPEQVLNAGTCSRRATVAVLDAFGNRSPLSASAVASVSVDPSLGFLVATDAACTMASDTVAVASGASELAFWFAGTVATTAHLTVSLPGLVAASQDARVIPEGFATQLVFVTTPQTVTAGACSGTVSVQTQDSHGNAVQNVGAVQVALAAEPPAGFALFSDSACSSPVSAVVIGAQRSTENFFFTGTVSGTVAVGASATGLMSASQLETIAAAAPARLTITSPPQTLPAGACSTPVRFELRDPFGNLAPATGALSVELSASPSAGFAFFPSATCAGAVPSVPVTAGATSGTFAFVGLASGVVAVTITSTGLAGDSQDELIQAGPPARLAFTSPAQDVAAGACSGAATLELQDAVGNPSSPSTDLAVGLASSTPTLSLFSDAACSRPASSLTLAAGGTTTAFFFLGTAVGQAVVTASTGGLYPEAQQTETIHAGAPAHLAFVTASQTLTSGACSPALTLEARDAQGNPTASAADVPITLSASAGGVTFYGDAACATPLGDILLTQGSARASFRFRATQAGTVTLSASTATLGQATQSQTVTPLPATQVVFVTPPRSATVGGCSDALTLETRDAAGNVSPVDAVTAVALSASPASGFNFFADAACATPVSSVSLAAGTGSATFRFIGTVPGSVVVTATPAGLSAASQTELVLPAAAPTQLVFTSAPQSVTAGGCSGAATLESRDSFGNPQSVGAATTVTLTAAPAAGLTFFTDATCTSPATSLAMATGVNSATLYFSGTAAGPVQLTASSSGFNSAQQTETITPAAPDHLVFLSAAQRLVAGACSAVVTLQSQDAYGNPSAPSGPRQVDLSATLAGGTTFFAGPSCGSPVTSVTLEAGATTVPFVFSATIAGTLTVTASVGGWPEASQVETIDAAAPDRLAFTTAPVTLAAGACSGAVVVRTADTYGNTAPVVAPTTVNLAASPGTGFQFFAAPGCGTAVASVAMATGSSTATLYLRGTLAGTVTVTVSATGMSPDTQSETITAALADRLVYTTGARTVTAGTCSPVLTVESRDPHGNPAPAPTSTPVVLLAAPDAGFSFFLDAACGSPGSPSLAAGASAASFHFRGTTAGTVTVTATAATWTPASQSEVVQAGAAASLAWDPISSPQAMGSPSGVRVVARDAHGNTAPTFAGTATLSIAPGGTMECSTSCTNATTTGPFSAGVWSGSVTFGPPAGTGRTLTATSGALSGTSNPFDVSNYPARSPPVARFTRTPAVVAPGVTVSFDATSSTDYQTASGNLQVSWDFSGVAATSPPAAPWTAWTTTKTATTSYAATGVYSPRLAVRDADGDVGYATLPLEVLATADTCVVTTNAMTDDGASSCAALGADGLLSLVEALRVTGNMPGRQAITFSGPMTITGGSTLTMRDVDVIAPSGVLLNTLTFEVPNGTSSRLSGVEMFGQWSPLVVRNSGTLVLTDSYLHDTRGISLEAGAAGQVIRTRMSGCTMACVSQSDSGSSPLLIRASTFADTAHPGVLMMAGNTASPILEAYGNVFVRMTLGILSWAAAPLRIQHNTFHDNTTALSVTGGNNQEVRNNIFSNNTTAASCGSATFASRDGQLLFNNASDGCLTAGTNTLTGDPLYQFLSGDDYRLQLSSPAVNSATILGLDLNDSAPGLYFGAGPDRGGRETW